MKKVVYIYRCQFCGNIFEGRGPFMAWGETKPESISVEHGTHDTHKCKSGQFGIGDLIGCVTGKTTRDYIQDKE